MIREEPFIGRFFQGSVEGEQGSIASLLIAPEGLYGGVHVDNTVYSLQPLPTGAKGVVVQQSTWRDPSYVQAAPTPLSEPSPLGEYGLWVKPYAEQSYVNLFSDWANRISAAYTYAAAYTDMWKGETIIALALYSIENTGTNFASGTVPCNPNVGLYNFRENWVQSHMFTGPNSYGLFHAYDDGVTVYGCGSRNCHGTPSGCLSNSNTGYNIKYAAHAVQGKDWCVYIPPNWCIDSYNPAETYDLAVVTHHELTHNAGEPDHPGDGSWPCDYNLMENGVAIDCSKFWRTAGSIDRVKTYSYSRIHPPP